MSHFLRPGLSFSIVCSVAAFLAFNSPAAEPNAMINLWPGDPPGEKMDVGPEQDSTKPTDNLIAGQRIIKLTNVKTPQAHVYLPPEGKRNGSSIVVCPGGGFNILAWDLEGIEVAQWLNSHGVAAIVLKYRVPTRNQNPVWLASVQDTQRTISLVRHHAKEWGLNTDRVGVLGFSAGGQAAVKAALTDKRQYDTIDATDAASCKPNIAVLIYSGGLTRSREDRSALPDDLVVTKDSPPMFLAHAFDDGVPVEGTAHLLVALKKAGVPSELHVYDAGGHGYGLRPVAELPVTTWTKPCEDWLRRAKWIP